MRELVDFALIEFADDQRTGRTAEELLALHDQGVIHVHHMVTVGKHREGGVYAADLVDAMPQSMRSFARPDCSSTDLLGYDDMRELARSMKFGHVAVLVVYEVTWAQRFDAAVSDSQGELVVSGRVPADDLMAALAVSETRGPTG